MDTFAAIPNLTGDGLPGLAVTTTAAAPGRPLAGVVYVLFSTSRSGTVSLGDPTLHGFKILGARSYDEAGFHITAAGDVNGDGRGDILLTAPRNGFTCASTESGPCGHAPHYAYVLYGKADEQTVDLAHLRRSQGFSIKGVPSGGPASDIAGLGRLDGGRYGAIAVTGSRYAYVVYGGHDPANVDLAHLGSRGFRITTGGRGASGPAVAATGDVNGDGRPDLLLYVQHLTSIRHAGVFVLFGAHYTRTITLSRLGGRGLAIPGGDVGAGVGDVNGDHLADLLVDRAGAGVHEYDIVYGSAHLHRIGLSTLGRHGRRILYGPVPAGYVQQLNVLAGLGDLNGDRRADVGISTETFRHGGAESQGTVSVVFGSRRSSSLSLANLGTAGYQLSTAATPPTCSLATGGNELGFTLGAVGDFSGGGRPEFAITALGLGPVPGGPCALHQGEVLVEALPAG